jgi:hypothetical protein
MGRIYEATGKSPIVNANLFLETSPEDSILTCLSERDVFIIRSYLWPFVQWRTRFALPIGGDVWEVSEDDPYREFLEACHLLDYKLTEDYLMACLDTGLTEIAAAIRLLASNQCCDTTNININGGVVSTWTDGEGVQHPIYGTNDPYINDGQTPPPGFETYEDYLLNKCQVANLVFDGWMLTLGGIAGFTVLNATVLATLLGVTIAGIIAFPPAAIPVMIGLILVLGVNIGLLANLRSELESNREQIICDLYASDTVESMTAVLGDALDTAIAALALTGIIGQTVKAIALLLVNSDTLSQLLSGVAGASYPDVDCSSCVCQMQWGIGGTVLGGTGDLSEGGPRTLTSTEYAPEGLHYIAFQGPCDCDGDQWEVTIESLTGYQVYDGEDGGDTAGGIIDCSDVHLWDYFEQVAPSGTYCGRYFTISGQPQPFSVSVSIARCAIGGGN